VSAVLVRQGPAVHSFPVTGQNIRTVLIDGEPWFAGRDVAEALGYANTRKALRDHVPAGHRRGNESFPLADLGFNQPQTVLIDEAGMYRLILRANTPTAEQFQEWVTAEVLPTIRRTGIYAVPQQAPAADVSSITKRDLARMILEEADRADAAEQRVAELEPFAVSWKALGTGGGSHSLRETGFILSQDPAIAIGQNNVMRFIREEEMVDSKGRPYSHHKQHLVLKPVTYDHPRTGEPVLTTQLRVTPLGIAYLRQRLGGIGREVTV
jgi:anti-repressor protein